MRIGIYGGTFNPPHIGHIHAAASFISAVDLDKLLIVPTYIPPHKSTDDFASAEDRLSMCQLAFSDLPNAVVSDMEIKRKGKSYTYLTLEELSGKDIDLYFLCGTDMFLTLETWMNFKRVFELATICYILRENDASLSKLLDDKAEEYHRLYHASTIKIDSIAINISSTEIRESIQKNPNESPMLDKKTLSYIIDRGLYL